MAFQKSSRLNKSSMILLVSRKGASLKSPFFRIKFLPARFGNTKIAIITAKKVEKSAVGRNSIRRKISSCFEECIKTEKENDKHFLITIFPTAKALLQTHKYFELEKEVTTVLEKINNFNFQKHNTSKGKHKVIKKRID